MAIGSFHRTRSTAGFFGKFWHLSDQTGKRSRLDDEKVLRAKKSYGQTGLHGSVSIFESYYFFCVYQVVKCYIKVVASALFWRDIVKMREHPKA